MCWSVGRVLSSRASRRMRWATIHLGPPLPAASCDLPASSNGPPSDASGEALRSRRHRNVGGGRRTDVLLILLQVGFTEPSRSPGTLVVSYTTLSPLPRPRGVPAVCFLWHFPAGHPGWALPTTLPCGA